MANHPDPTRSTGSTGGSRADDMTTEKIFAAIEAEEHHGATADQVALALGLGFDGTVVQDTLEDLVEQGRLDRLRIGYAAIYTRNAMA